MLRAGCFGCLTMLAAGAVVIGLFAGLFQASRAPEVAAIPTSPADGIRAQQKVFDAIRRGAEGKTRTVSLSEGELNAFVNRHLEVRDLPLRDLTVRLPSVGRAEIVGQIPLGQLLAMPPASAMAALLPASWLERPVWLSIRTRVSVESVDRGREARRLRLDVEGFSIGRLPLPEFMLRVLLDPAALRLLRSPLPDAISALRVEPGKLVIQSGS